MYHRQPEPNAAKPDAPTDCLHDHASSEEDKRVAPFVDQKPSYYIRAYQQRCLPIEYTATKCSLLPLGSGWRARTMVRGPDGTQCRYSNTKSGTHSCLANWRGTMRCVNAPFGEDNLLKSSAARADVLDMIVEAPIARPSTTFPKSSPEILKTLQLDSEYARRPRGRTVSTKGLYETVAG